MSNEIRPSQPQRIVIVRPSALGDICRSVPVLASVRAALPAAHIAWVVQDDFADAVTAHPALNEVIAFPRSRFGRWWKSPGRAGEVRRWFSDLRKRRFDVALDCQGLSRSGLITRATRAPLRIGLRSAREFAWLCYNRRVPEDDQPLAVHTVDRMMSLLAPLGIAARHDMRLYAPPAAQAWWDEYRARLGQAAGDAYAVIAPGSRWISKRWPIDRFADLVEPLLRRGFQRVLVIGSPAERDQARPLTERFGSSACRIENGAAASNPSGASIIDLVGATSIGQTMALVAGAGLVIANDSAPLHMAVGFDRPCVALFGPTDPAAVGPYRRAECVVRAFQPKADERINYKDDRLGDSLMRLISSAMALQAIDRVLSLWPQRDRTVVTASQAPATEPDAVRNNGSPMPLIDIPRGLAPRTAS